MLYDQKIMSILNVRASGTKVIKMTMKINTKVIPMSLDTGCAVSLISENVYETFVLSVHSSVQLKTYTNKQVNVLGEINVTVEYGNQRKILPLIVVEGDGHSLFGRNWLNEIKLV